MRAGERALAALDAEVGFPDRRFVGDVALFPRRGADGKRAVDGHRADRKLVAAPGHDRGGEALHERRSRSGHDRLALELARRGWRYGDLAQVNQRMVDRGEIARHDLAALAPVALLDHVLDALGGLFARQHAGNREEARLQHRIDAAAQAGVASDFRSVDDEQPQMLVDDLLLHRARQAVPRLLGLVGAVQKKRRVRRREPQHVQPAEERELMAGHEIRRRDQIGGANRAWPEAKVRHGLRARLVRIVDEVALRIAVGVLGEDFDAVLVRPDGAVRSEPVEHRAHHVVRLDHEGRVDVEAGAGHVVGDADRETVARRLLVEFVERRLRHGGREILGGKSVAAADHPRHERPLAGGDRLGQRADDVEIERLAGRARLLGALEDGDRPDRSGQCGEEMFGGERPKQAHLQNAQLAPRLGPPQRGGGLARGLRRRSDQHDRLFGVRRAFIFEQSIAAPDDPGERRHRPFDDRRRARVERAGRLARLEEGVRIVRGAAHDGLLRRQRAAAMGANEIVADHRAHLGVREQRELVHLVRGAESVEEMHERNAAFEGRRLGDQGEVVSLLHRTGAEQGEAAGADRHHVGMVAEDRQRLGGDRARRDMEHRRGQLAGDLEHVGQHQQQALGGREGRRQRAGLQRAMDRAGGAALALHLLHDRHVAEDVANAERGPFVGEFGHRRRRRDRKDRAHLVDAIRDMRDGGVAVHRVG